MHLSYMNLDSIKNEPDAYFAMEVAFGGWIFRAIFFNYCNIESDIGDERLGSCRIELIQVVVHKRKTNRLNLDSEEEARLEAEEQARQDEIRQRKE